MEAPDEILWCRNYLNNFVLAEHCYCWFVLNGSATGKYLNFDAEFHSYINMNAIILGMIGKTFPVRQKNLGHLSIRSVDTAIERPLDVYSLHPPGSIIKWLMLPTTNCIEDKKKDELSLAREKLIRGRPLRDICDKLKSGRRCHETTTTTQSTNKCSATKPKLSCD